MGGNLTGGQRTVTSRQIPDNQKLTRLRRHYRCSTALSNRALFWGAPLVGAALLSAVPAVGNPTGGSVVGGSATISGEGTGNVTVNQATDRAILHWDDFSIGAGETTQFIQPGSDALAVNRVTGTAQSLLLGTLTANGNVWIINPNGLLAGAGSIIDVNGFLASTADILDSDILDGDDRFTFNIPSTNPDASIVNFGEISVGDRGLAALVAPGVENDGLIVGRMAQVVLGGAETFALDFAGDGLLSFEVTSAVASAPDGMTDLVTNSGLIDAPGGLVLLTAETMDGVVDNVINMSGVIQAQTLTTASGTVVLSGGDSGIVSVTGTIDASGTDAGETGGTVKLLGDTVVLELDALVDASGDAGGGTVLVGGNFQGNGPEQNASLSFVGADAAIYADALTVGDGGTVIVWADGYTDFYGNISARGGAVSGDGGFAEVSGKDGLGYRGLADLSAANGDVGTLLLDPATLTIRGGSGDGDSDGSTTTFAGAGTAGKIDAGDTVSEVYETEIEAQSEFADIELRASESVSTAGDFLDNKVTLFADSNLTIETTNEFATGLLDLTTSLDGSGLAFVTQGTGTITIAGSTTGNFKGSVVVGGLTSDGGTITVSSGDGSVRLENPIDAGTGTVRLFTDVTTVNASIFDAHKSSTPDVTAGSLSMRGINIGTGAGAETGLNNALDVDVDRVEASATGYVELSFAGDIEIGEVADGVTGVAGGITSGGDTILVASSASGTITDAAGTTLDVAGLAAFDAGTGGITLGDDAGDTTNFGSLDVAGGTVVVTEDSATVLAAADVTDLTLDSSGTITQTGTVLVSGTADLTANDGAAQAITLADTSNDFGTLLADGSTVTIEDTDAIILGDTTASSLDVTAGGTITDAAGTTLDVAGLATFDAGSDGITLGDDAGDTTNFGTLNVTGGTVVVTEDSATVLTGVNADSFDLTAGGTITDAASTTLDVTGLAAFDAGTNGITLGDDVGDTTNFGSLDVTGTTVVVTEDSATVLAAADVTDLTLVSSGTITDSGTVLVSGTADLTANDGAAQTIELNTGANDFGTVTADGAAVTLVDTDAIILDDITASSLDVTAGGTITDAAGTTLDVTGLAAFDSGTDGTTLGDDAGDTTNFGSLDVAGTTVVVTEDSATVLAAADVTDLTLDSSGTITQTGTVLVSGTADLTANDGAAQAITLADTSNDFGTLLADGSTVTIEDTDAIILGNITASSLDVTAGGTITDAAGTTLDVAGLAAFDSGTDGITLGDDAGDTTNFGSLDVAGGTVVVTEDSATVLAAADVTDLTLDSSGTITQTGTVLVSGTADLTANDGAAQAITLADTSNDFGTLLADGSTVTIEDTDAIILGDTTASSLDVTAGGTITDAAGATVAANNLTLSSTDSITLDGDHQIGTLNSVTRAGSFELNDTTGGLVVAGPIGDGAGDVTITTAGGALALTGAIAADGDNVTLTGEGVTANALGDVDAGAGDITVDGETGVITISGAEFLSTGIVTMIADEMDFVAGAQIGGSSTPTDRAQRVVLRPTTAGTDFDLGSAAVSATAGADLTDAELDTIRADQLRIGSDGTGSENAAGTITVGTWSVPAQAADSVLTLVTATDITQTGALTLDTGTGLILRAGTSVSMGNTGNDLSSVAGSAGTGSFTLANSDALTVASLTDEFGALSGITAQDGVTLSAATGGIVVDEAVAANAGDVSITAAGNGQTLENNADISGTNVSLTADRMAIDAASTVVAGQVVTLDVANAGDSIDIGSAVDTAIDTLELSIVELSTVTAPDALRIGSSDTGAIVITDALADPNAGTDTVALISGGSVTQSDVITVSNLRVEGSLIALGLDNDVGEFAAEATGGIEFTDTNALNIGTVDGLSGVTTTGAFEFVELNADDLNIDQAIVSSYFVFLNPYTDERPVALGGSGGDPLTEFTLSDGELDNIATGNLVVGFQSGVSSTFDGDTFIAGDYNVDTISSSTTSDIGMLYLFADGDMTFDSTVDGAFDLRLDFTGDVNFNEDVGTSTRPGFVQFNTPQLGTTSGNVFVNNGIEPGSEIAQTPINGFTFNASDVRINIQGRAVSGQTLFGTNTNFDGFNVDSLTVFRSAGVDLFGSIQGDNTQTAASRGTAAGGQNPDWLFNGCIIGGLQCFNVPIILPVAGLDLSLEDERLLREPLIEDEDEFEDLLSNTGNEELW